MFILWKIRYLDRADKKFKDRSLCLDTEVVDPAVKAAVEFVIEASKGKSERNILRFRKHFIEDGSDSLAKEAAKNPRRMHAFALVDYLEDDQGNEISLDEMGKILTGNPNTRMFPGWFQPHDIEYALADQKPIPVAEITLSSEDVKTLGYFVKDYKELVKSPVLVDGAGTLTHCGQKSTLVTAASDDEIRSFVTIYRRLYMQGEPANFLKAVGIFSSALGDHPIGKWVKGVGQQYEAAMSNTKLFPFASQGQTTFTAKDLIDVLIYTQYAHQPLGKNEHRQQEHDDYLQQLGGDKAKLTWMCLSEILRSATTISNAGQMIAVWFDRYCQHHQSTADVLASLQDEHPGIGSQEKQADRSARILSEKVQALAEAIWKRHGCPAGGSALFLEQARLELSSQLHSDSEGGLG